MNKKTKFSSIKPKERLPNWIHFPKMSVSSIENVQKLIKQNNIHTICEEGRCPNRNECYASGTASFLLGGSICTRSCAFCQVNKGVPSLLDDSESQKVANSIKTLKLKYVVLTSVARDDLKDHGASLFVKTIKEIRKISPDVKIEILIPDFWGGSSEEKEKIILQKQRLEQVLRENPVCLNHNLETVERLQRKVRQGANYINSIRLLDTARKISPYIPTKSGLMLGLGETYNEIISTLKDLKEVGCKEITIGQYLRPSLSHLPVEKYWTIQEFKKIKKECIKLGFNKVMSGPLVRSSYHAGG
tara:strand:+ start:7614 stop:8519 length:906 start_codon:yes stop_codon:yes gene_type:complete